MATLGSLRPSAARRPEPDEPTGAGLLLRAGPYRPTRRRMCGFAGWRSGLERRTLVGAPGQRPTRPGGLLVRPGAPGAGELFGRAAASPIFALMAPARWSTHRLPLADHPYRCPGG